MASLPVQNLRPGTFGLALLLDGKGHPIVVDVKTDRELAGVQSIEYRTSDEETDTATIVVHLFRMRDDESGDRHPDGVYRRVNEG